MKRSRRKLPRVFRSQIARLLALGDHGRSKMVSGGRHLILNVSKNIPNMEVRSMSIKLKIMEQMTQVAREHGKVLARLTDDLQLAESGLDSLAFAVLVA